MSSRPIDSVDAVLALAREDIRELKAYEHAQWRPELERLHANELPWSPLSCTDGAPRHHYPEPQPAELVEAMAGYYGVAADQILLGRGSDEGIDLLTRAFCRAERDAVMVCPPTFGMYAVAATIQGAGVVSVPLLPDFQLDLPAICSALQGSAAAPIKLVWLCSPNNPTGNSLQRSDIAAVIDAARGRAVVVVDEAYAEFSSEPSWILSLPKNPHLVVLRTLSKAHGLAGLRVGAVIGHRAIIQLLRKIIPPYALPTDSVRLATIAMEGAALAVTRERVGLLSRERERLRSALSSSTWLTRIWPSAANFLLVEARDGRAVLERLAGVGLIVRDFRGKSGLGEAIRITVGTPDQNDRIIRSLS
jgi:histidinol-phosphate aminotransferase